MKFQLIILISFISINNLCAQGCSDAGFCTMPGLKPEAEKDTELALKNSLKVGYFIGSADHNIAISGAYLTYNRVITDRFNLSSKLSFLRQKGNQIDEAGPSDLFLNGSYLISNSLQLIVGTKIPLTNSNKYLNSKPLPLDYQSSLGTFDFIAGIGYSYKNFSFNTAFQQPLTQNKNEFLAQNLTANDPLIGFQSTNQFKRSGDVLLRATYNYKIGEKWLISPSLLPIYHLKNDLFTNNAGIQQEIEGSKGLTFNANLYANYSFNQSNKIELSFGAPFITRKARPDGLTRGFVLTLEYQLKF